MRVVHTDLETCTYRERNKHTVRERERCTLREKHTQRYTHKEILRLRDRNNIMFRFTP